MILIFLVAFAVGSHAKGGTYYAEPSFVTNLEQTHPEVSNFYFYLQQMSKWKVLFRGDIEIKRTVGPMQARLDYLFWTGKAFVRASGVTSGVFIQNLCEIPGLVQFLRNIEPQSGLNVKECTFLAGNYTSEIDWDKYLHEGSDQQTYEPKKLQFAILEKGAMLFGFTIQMTYHDLNLYKFIPKD